MTIPGVPVDPPWLAILPPLIGIVLCFLTKRVLFSLFIGVFCGCLMLTKGNPFYAIANTSVLYFTSLAGVTVDIPFSFASELEGVTVDLFKPTIILFDFVIGGLIGLIYMSGGAHGFANMLSLKIRTRRGAEIASAGMGCLIFFDDYSNTAVVGSSMRPLADKMKLSKEKFSYIIDSTAAPIATIAIISTWIGYELGVIKEALGNIGAEINPYSLFIQSIPYSFYSFFALLLVFTVAITGRNFGPMLEAEHRSIKTGKLLRDGATPLMPVSALQVKPGVDQKAINFIIPIISLVSISLFGMWWTGGGPSPDIGFLGAIAESNSMLALLWGTVGASIIAMVLYGLQRTANLSEMMDAFINGTKTMVLANLILLSAWSISEICNQVGTADFMVAMVKDIISPWSLPIILFLISALIAFSTGTSWATMALVLPTAIALAYSFTPIVPLHITVAAVLTGSIMGDHCSPISDTTVISSAFAGADHLDHVRTQIPYSLVAFFAAAIAFLIVSADLESKWILFVAFPVGALFVIAGLFIFSAWDMKKKGITLQLDTD